MSHDPLARALLRAAVALALLLALTGCPPSEADRERDTHRRVEQRIEWIRQDLEVEIEWIRQDLEVEAFRRAELRRLGLVPPAACTCSIESAARGLRAATEAR